MLFLEWLLRMGVLFYGWLVPISIGSSFINGGQIFLGVIIVLTAIPIEYMLFKLQKKVEGKRIYGDEIKAKEHEEWEKELQSKREEAERLRKERILTSPIKQLTPIEFEEFTAQYFIKLGYKHVKSTPTTGDYGADILATSPKDEKVCVQCKRYSKPVGVKAIQEIHAAKQYYKCNVAIVVVTSKGYTAQARNLASNLGVRLYEFNDVTHDFFERS